MVSMIAGVYDDQGYVVDVSITTLPVPIFSEETLPFSFTNWQVLNRDSRYQENATNYSIQWDPQNTIPNHNDYVHLTTIDNQINNNSSAIIITGSVLNDTTNTVGDIVIIGVIYDQESAQIQAVTIQKMANILHLNQSVDYYLVFDVNQVNSPTDNNVVITAKGKVMSEEQ